MGYEEENGVVLLEHRQFYFDIHDFYFDKANVYLNIADFYLVFYEFYFAIGKVYLDDGKVYLVFNDFYLDDGKFYLVFYEFYFDDGEVCFDKGTFRLDFNAVRMNISVGGADFTGFCSNSDAFGPNDGKVTYKSGPVGVNRAFGGRVRPVGEIVKKGGKLIERYDEIGSNFLTLSRVSITSLLFVPPMVKFKVSIPRKVEEQLDLASRVAARHALDGASSILNSLQDYSWNSLASTIPTCLAKHVEAETLEHRIKIVYPERTRLLTPIVSAVRATRTLLLGVFRATPTRLGDWGFDVVMAGGRPRVTIPKNVKELLALAKLIAQKHATDGATSVLNGLQDYSWTTLAPTIQPCFDKNQEAEQLDSDREQAYQVRNQLLPPIVNALRASRDLLLGAFAANATRLGDWGFDVSQITRKPKPKPIPA